MIELKLSDLPFQSMRFKIRGMPGPKYDQPTITHWIAESIDYEGIMGEGESPGIALERAMGVLLEWVARRMGVGLARDPKEEE